MFEQGTLINLYCHVSGTRASKGQGLQLSEAVSPKVNPRQRGDMIKQQWITIIIIEAKFSKIQSNENFKNDV